jgi:hypothetical protein
LFEGPADLGDGQDGLADPAALLLDLVLLRGRVVTLDDVLGLDQRGQLLVLLGERRGGVGGLDDRRRGRLPGLGRAAPLAVVRGAAQRQRRAKAPPRESGWF